MPLKPNEYREFRITVENVTDEKESPYYALSRSFRQGDETKRTEATSVERRPLRIDRIGFWYEVDQEQQRKAKTAAYPVVDYQRSESPKTQQTVLSVRNAPRTDHRIRAGGSQPEFLAAVTVQVPVVRGTKTEWREVARKTLIKLDFHTLQRTELTIEFPEQRKENYRILIENQDNPSLDVTGVRAIGNVYRAAFLNEPERLTACSMDRKPPSRRVTTRPRSSHCSARTISPRRWCWCSENEHRV